ncbi:MAG: hypothetical protein DDT29_02390 [Dehalococcoidia bacterium]|nr:hypothetical protein [Bacillota bacterium]
MEAALRYYDRAAVGERLLLAYELAGKHKLPQEYELREYLNRFFPAELDRLEMEEEEENDDEQMLPIINEVITAEALARKWAEKEENITLLRKDIELLRTRYDLEEVEEAMDEYEDIERGDYDNAEEYQDARNEAWEAILEALDDVEKLEEKEEEEVLPTKDLMVKTTPPRKKEPIGKTISDYSPRLKSGASRDTSQAL